MASIIDIWAIDEMSHKSLAPFSYKLLIDVLQTALGITANVICGTYGMQEEEEWKSVLEQTSLVLSGDTRGKIESLQADVGVAESDASTLLPLQKQAHRRLCFQVRQRCRFTNPLAVFALKVARAACVLRNITDGAHCDCCS